SPPAGRASARRRLVDHAGGRRDRVVLLGPLRARSPARARGRALAREAALVGRRGGRALARLPRQAVGADARPRARRRPRTRTPASGPAVPRLSRGGGAALRRLDRLVLDLRPRS